MKSFLRRCIISAFLSKGRRCAYYFKYTKQAFSNAIINFSIRFLFLQSLQITCLMSSREPLTDIDSDSEEIRR